MNVLETFSIEQWSGGCTPADQLRALQAVENGKLIFLPRLPFRLEESERRFLDPSCSDGHAKNISFDPQTGEVRGASQSGRELNELMAMLLRYANHSRELIEGLLPHYRGRLQQARASFRPLEVDNRPSSYRKDDRRLHVDAFPSRPNQGRRILRVFSNVNPEQPRVWQVGEPFQDFAVRFLPRLRPPRPGSAWLLERLGITRGHRSAYDHFMLKLHDGAKAD